MRNRLLLAGWTLALFAGLSSASESETAPAQPSSQRMTPVVRMIDRALQGTVSIHTEKRQQKSLDVMFSASKGANKVNGMGTGLIVDERGYILTNNHVIQDVESISVTRHNGEKYIATVFQTDPKADLAIIQIQPRAPLPVIPMGTSSDLMLAETVFAVGNAFGYTDTVTQGIISHLHRNVEAGEDQSYENLIQTDAAINPGNSGGPLLNMDGEVIGINVAIRAGASKIGFAIPIDAARTVMAKMMSAERNSNVYHGAQLRDYKAGRVRELRIQGVKPNSPAALAGLQPGDVVLKLNSTQIIDGADFERALLDRKISEKLPLVVNRGGREETLDLALVPASPELASSNRQTVTANLGPSSTTTQVSGARSDRVWELLGMRLQTVGKSDARLENLPYQGGMMITDVRRDSAAFQNGVKRGDILVGLHSYETVKDNDVLYVLNNTDFKPNAPLKFYIVRERETLFGYFTSSTK